MLLSKITQYIQKSKYPLLTYKKEKLDLSDSSLRLGASTGRITTMDTNATNGGTVAHNRRKGPVCGAYTAV